MENVFLKPAPVRFKEGVSSFRIPKILWQRQQRSSTTSLAVALFENNKNWNSKERYYGFQRNLSYDSRRKAPPLSWRDPKNIVLDISRGNFPTCIPIHCKDEAEKEKFLNTNSDFVYQEGLEFPDAVWQALPDLHCRCSGYTHANFEHQPGPQVPTSCAAACLQRRLAHCDDKRCIFWSESRNRGNIISPKLTGDGGASIAADRKITDNGDGTNNDAGSDQEGDYDEELAIIMYECGMLCECYPNCPQNVLLNGPYKKLSLYLCFFDDGLGWRVHARTAPGARVPKNTFLLEYAGRVVDNVAEAVADGDQNSYVFGLINSTLSIDAEKQGNISRWMNHSCEPNCVAIAAYAGHSYVGFHRLAIVTKCPIAGDGALTLDYGDDWWLAQFRAKRLLCLCKKSSCRYDTIEKLEKLARDESDDDDDDAASTKSNETDLASNYSRSFSKKRKRKLLEDLSLLPSIATKRNRIIAEQHPAVEVLPIDRPETIARDFDGSRACAAFIRMYMYNLRVEISDTHRAIDDFLHRSDSSVCSPPSASGGSRCNVAVGSAAKTSLETTLPTSSEQSRTSRRCLRLHEYLPSNQLRKQLISRSSKHNEAEDNNKSSSCHDAVENNPSGQSDVVPTPPPPTATRTAMTMHNVTNQQPSQNSNVSSLNNDNDRTDAAEFETEQLQTMLMPIPPMSSQQLNLFSSLYQKLLKRLADRQRFERLLGSFYTEQVAHKTIQQLFSSCNLNTSTQQFNLKRYFLYFLHEKNYRRMSLQSDLLEQKVGVCLARIDSKFLIEPTVIVLAENVRCSAGALCRLDEWPDADTMKYVKPCFVCKKQHHVVCYADNRHMADTVLGIIKQFDSKKSSSAENKLPFFRLTCSVCGAVANAGARQHEVKNESLFISMTRSIEQQQSL